MLLQQVWLEVVGDVILRADDFPQVAFHPSDLRAEEDTLAEDTDQDTVVLVPVFDFFDLKSLLNLTEYALSGLLDLL